MTWTAHFPELWLFLYTVLLLFLVWSWGKGQDLSLYIFGSLSSHSSGSYMFRCSKWTDQWCITCRTWSWAHCMSNGDDDAYLEGSWDFKSYEAPEIVLGIEKLSALGAFTFLSWQYACCYLQCLNPCFQGCKVFIFLLRNSKSGTLSQSCSGLMGTVGERATCMGCPWWHSLQRWWKTILCLPPGNEILLWDQVQLISTKLSGFGGCMVRFQSNELSSVAGIFRKCCAWDLIHDDLE